MAKSKKYVIGNWKMNPYQLEEARRIASKVRRAAALLRNVRTVACPPYPYLATVSGKAGNPLALGAQDVFTEVSGSFTGEVSAEMVASIGASYAIVGHSERRKMGETDALVAAKAAAAVRAGLVVVVCVGETVRDAEGKYLEYLASQIRESLSKVARKDLKFLVVAYEPVWAIGASSAMSPADVHETAIFVRKVLSDLYGQAEAGSVPVLYGGAVTGRNAGDIMREGEVDGLLVGRESLNPEGFIQILKAADALAK